MSVPETTVCQNVYVRKGLMGMEQKNAQSVRRDFFIKFKHDVTVT